MTHSSEELFALLDSLEIEHQTVEHPAFFTVEEGLPYHDRIKGLHCKNLFMKDKKGHYYLALLPAEKRAHITRIEKQAGAARLSFASPELLKEVLDITPGSVTPFALWHDTEKKVTVIVDEEIPESETVNFHPLRNTASTTLKSADLLRFLHHMGYEPLFMDCGHAAEEALKKTA